MGRFTVPRYAEAGFRSEGSLHVACVQLASDGDVAANWTGAESALREAATRGVRLALLPEKWNGIGTPEILHAVAEPLNGPTTTKLQSLARELDMWIHSGSMVESIDGDDRLRNTSVLINPAGEITSTYRKMHMFDVSVAGVEYKESDTERPGSLIELAYCDDIPLGMSICYDLRFPELYRSLAVMGARIIVVPAAFTLMTGRDHWEVLLRARAIENQCFVMAAGIIGDHGEGKVSYGRSMIIDPWGVVLTQAGDTECVIDTNLDLGAVDRVRQSVPALATRRPDVYGLPVDDD